MPKAKKFTVSLTVFVKWIVTIYKNFWYFSGSCSTMFISNWRCGEFSLFCIPQFNNLTYLVADVLQQSYKIRTINQFLVLIQKTRFCEHLLSARTDLSSFLSAAGVLKSMCSVSLATSAMLGVDYIKSKLKSLITTCA